jgi:hypothetical protein
VELKALKLNRDLVTEEEQHDLEHLGIAKNAREEKIRARDARQKNDPAYNDKMAKLYREVVLKEKQPEGFIPLTTLAPSNGNGNGKGTHHEETEAVLGD